MRNELIKLVNSCTPQSKRFGNSFGIGFEVAQVKSLLEFIPKDLVYYLVLMHVFMASRSSAAVQGVPT